MTDLDVTNAFMVTVNERRHIYAPIVTAMKGPSQKIVVVHMKWWWSLSVIVINIRDGPWMSPQHILSATPPLVKFSFLVTEAIFRHHSPYEMVTVTICHYESLLVMDLECHHNTYTFSATSPLVMFSFWWRRLFWPSPMSLWWPFSPLTNVLFSCSESRSKSTVRGSNS